MNINFRFFLKSGQKLRYFFEIYLTLKSLESRLFTVRPKRTKKRTMGGHLPHPPPCQIGWPQLELFCPHWCARKNHQLVLLEMLEDVLRSWYVMIWWILTVRLLGGFAVAPTQKWWKKCSTAKSFIPKELTSYKICILIKKAFWEHIFF